jgi:hypothetical protein
VQGRVYRQIAKNKIESAVMVGHRAERQERFVANPVCDGNRLYRTHGASRTASRPASFPQVVRLQQLRQLPDSTRNQVPGNRLRVRDSGARNRLLTRSVEPATFGAWWG